MDVTIVARQRRRRIALSPLAAFSKRLARRLPPASATSCTIVLCGDRTVRELNRRYRGNDATTDVLSFASGERELPDGTRPLGEIVISVAQARRQAKAAGHSTERELRILVLHGYLHLLGYDHEVDNGTMMRLQARLTRMLLPPVSR